MSDHTALGDPFLYTDAILIYLTQLPTTTLLTRVVAYLELVIHLLNVTRILLQNTQEPEIPSAPRSVYGTTWWDCETVVLWNSLGDYFV